MSMSRMLGMLPVECLCQQIVERLEYFLEPFQRRVDRWRIRIKRGWVFQEPARRAEMIEFGNCRRHQLEEGFRLFYDA